METIKVNMNPNPLDVQTIHASQNDGEARQWEFELHNNGELIDTSDVKEQLVFKAYKGGTEQLLPENGSTPTTSPFKGDIKYPQGLLTDQEFLYRESPTEEDGLAKITDIKGNTIVWNQLVQNGNFADTSTWSAESGATLSISNNIATIASTTANNGIRQYFPNPLTVGHKYLIKAEFNVPTEYRCVIGTAANQGVQVDKLISTANTWTEVIGIGTCTVATTSFYCYVRGSTTYENVKVRNVMCVDLTEMFGAGNESTTVEEFTSLFPLSYYSYNQGSLLSFMGNGIKTVGKNLFDFSQFANGTITFENGDLKGTAGQFSASYSNVVSNGIELKYPENTQITISFDARTEQNDTPSGNGIYLMASENGTSTRLARATNETSSIQHITATIPSNRHIDKLGWTYGANALNIWHITNFQVEFGATETSYEPYTSSTLSLPISTYFPNGMDGVGTDYDELTNTKATTRMTRVDLGTLDWGVSNGTMYANLPDAYMPSTGATVANAICPKYTTASLNYVIAKSQDKILALNNGQPRVNVYDSAYTDATAFKTAMSGVYLVYPLATPIETSITTASLVTENGEVSLANENGVLIGKCNSDVSADAGFIEGKIKLSDENGDVYSNKIQIHVERSPQ